MTVTTSAELLAPAGNWVCLRAAVENGADAVYFGVDAFNARARADNFHRDDLPEVMAHLRARGVRGYLTLNVLVFTEEVEEAADLLVAASDAGVDAVLMQDLGMARLAQRLVPELPIHASTQMTVTSPEAITLLQQWGLRRFVLPREFSVEEIRRVHEAADTELEAFVHGALCVAYSGQCLTSESFGGRSANRGECAQACRQPYTMLVDGDAVDLGNRRYLLSPQDLAGIELIPEMLRAGIVCFKVEGRLKTPEYVANITRRYRRALDQALAGEEVRLQKDEWQELAQSFSRGLTHGFLDGTNHQTLVRGDFPKSRGLPVGTVVEVRPPHVVVSQRSLPPGGPEQSEGARKGEARVARSYAGASHPGAPQAPSSLSGRRPKVSRSPAKDGLEWGLRSNTDATPHPGALRPASPARGEEFAELKRGDGIVFDNGDPERKEPGGPIYALEQHAPARNAQDPMDNARWGEGKPITPSDSTIILSLAHDFPFGDVSPGDRVWKTGDPALNQRLRASYATDRRTLGVHLAVDGAEGEPLQVRARIHGYAEETAVAIRSQEALVPATGAGLTVDLVGDKLGALGGTRFHLATLDVSLSAPLMLPVSALKRLRRALVARLDALVETPPVRRKHPQALAQLRDDPLSEAAASVGPSTFPETASRPQLSVFCRSEAQIRAACAAGVDRVYADFEDPRGFRESVAVAREAGIPIYLATPRIEKPREEGFFRKLAKANPDGVLVRNLGGLLYFREKHPDFDLIGDFSLNCANDLTARELLGLGLRVITPSYDLNAEQLDGLLQRIPGERFEIVLHQYMPMFHMEHCVFAAVLSEGKDYRDCGRPCERHDVALRDHTGALLPVKADVGCRNTVFNGSAQSGALYLDRFRELNVGHYRLELLTEDADRTRDLIGIYHSLLRGEKQARTIWTTLQASQQLGVTKGTLEHR